MSSPTLITNWTVHFFIFHPGEDGATVDQFLQQIYRVRVLDGNDDRVNMHLFVVDDAEDKRTYGED